ncbi:MAG TPA: CBS domain-containing protein, partial [Candidatus Nitrosotalea sp.]|nr:CBS domain-containing protein [Candidatus Nitrosotalea sp.]
MNSPQIVYAHLNEVRNFKVSKILKKATIIDSSHTVSKVVGVLVNSDSYDAFCIDGKDVLTISARDLLSVKNVENMKIKPLLRKIQPLTKSDTVEKAAAILSHYRMRSVPIVEGNQIIGV